MKKVYLGIMLVAALSLNANAQDEMKSVWETKLEHKAEENELDEASGYIISSNEKEMTILDANTGKTKWTKDFKTLCGGIMKKVDERIPMWEAKAYSCLTEKEEEIKWLL